MYQAQKMSAGHARQIAGGQRVWGVVVVDVNVQAVHHIEMGVGKQLFHGGIAHLGVDLGPNKGTKIVARGQGAGLLQGGRRRSFGGSRGGVGRGAWLDARVDTLGRV
jgi:hypothetical protein